MLWQPGNLPTRVTGQSRDTPCVFVCCHVKGNLEKIPYILRRHRINVDKHIYLHSIFYGTYLCTTTTSLVLVWWKQNNILRLIFDWSYIWQPKSQSVLMCIWSDATSTSRLVNQQKSNNWSFCITFAEQNWTEQNWKQHATLNWQWLANQVVSSGSKPNPIKQYVNGFQMSVTANYFWYLF